MLSDVVKSDLPRLELSLAAKPLLWVTAAVVLVAVLVLMTTPFVPYSADRGESKKRVCNEEEEI